MTDDYPFVYLIVVFYLYNLVAMKNNVNFQTWLRLN